MRTLLLILVILLLFGGGGGYRLRIFPVGSHRRRRIRRPSTVGHSHSFSNGQVGGARLYEHWRRTPDKAGGPNNADNIGNA